MILEACRSSALSDRPIFGSVAPALLRSGVGSVIAFSHSVHVEAAKLLVERFYEELADGLTVGQAFCSRTTWRRSASPGAAGVSVFELDGLTDAHLDVLARMV